MKEPWEFANNVALGMKVLDEKRPGWVALIDLELLNLGDGFCCVLGQLYGEYERGLQQMGMRASRTWSETHGFYVDTALTSIWASLTTAWTQAIEARRTEKSS